MKVGSSWKISEKYSNVKFHKNPFSGTRVVPWEQTDRRIDRDRRTEMMKLTVAFRILRTRLKICQDASLCSVEYSFVMTSRHINGLVKVLYRKVPKWKTNCSWQTKTWQVIKINYYLHISGAAFPGSVYSHVTEKDRTGSKQLEHP